MRLVWTQAGHAALVNAENDGTNAVRVAAIALGSGNAEATPQRTALDNEHRRLDTFGGAAVASNIIHVAVRDESDSAYTVREFGLIGDDADATLLAIYSQDAPIIEKAAGSTLLLPIDATLTDVDATMIEFGDLAFSNPPASTRTQGVAELADDAEARAGDDALRIMTPHAARIAREQYGLGATAPSVSDLDGLERSGLYRVIGADIPGDLPGSPDSTGVAGLLHIQTAGDQAMQQLRLTRDSQHVYTRVRYGNWGPWVAGLTGNNYASAAEARAGERDDRIMSPARTRDGFGVFGLGTAAADTDDPNEIDRSGFYRTSVDGAPGMPTAIGDTSFAGLLHHQRNTGQATQIALHKSRTQAWLRTLYEYGDTPGWSDWLEFMFCEAREVSNPDNINQGGFYKTASGGAQNMPAAIGDRSFCGILHIQRLGGAGDDAVTQATQLAFEKTTPRLWMRTQNDAGALDWSAWVELFTDNSRADRAAATAGERHDRVMTPLRVFEAIDAWVSGHTIPRGSLPTFSQGGPILEAKTIGDGTTYGLDYVRDAGVYGFGGAISGAPGDGRYSVMHVLRDPGGARVAQQLYHYYNETVYWRLAANVDDDTPVEADWIEYRHAGNTVVDSNGFLKEASPVLRLYADTLKHLNGAAGELKRLGTGHYRVTGTSGFAREGWYIENARDANGNVKRFVEYDEHDDGTIEIRTYTPDYSGGYAARGDPQDIPPGRWIDLRLQAM